jgi:hypothetical protein
MVTVVSAATGNVVTLKPPEVEPAGIVMLEGTVAAEVFKLESKTAAPPVGAAVLSVAVPGTAAPARAVVGLSVNEDSAGGAGVTVSVVVLVVPL